MEKIKLKIEVLKYKITLFTTILGAGIYLWLHKKEFIPIITELMFFGIVTFIMMYGISGFFINIFELNKIKKEIENG